MAPFCVGEELGKRETGPFTFDRGHNAIGLIGVFEPCRKLSSSWEIREAGWMASRLVDRESITICLHHISFIFSFS